MSQRLRKYLLPILSVILSILIGAIIIAIAGFSPISAYSALIKGAFGTLPALLGTLEKSVPLVFCGLAAAVAFRGGMFNIGLEGQLYMGAAAYALIGVALPNMPLPLHVLICGVCAMLAGGLWSCVAAVLKIWKGASEVVTTIMLNYIAINFIAWLISGPFMDEGVIAQSKALDSSLLIPAIIPNLKLTWAYPLAIIAAVIIMFIYRYTTIGYDMTAAGINYRAAEAGGVRPNKIRMISMGLSGALAGLAGGMLVAASYGRLVLNISPGYGFDGLAIAVLGQNSPLGVILSSILFGGLRTGSLYMDMFVGIPSEVISVLQGIIILIISAPLIFSTFIRNRRSSS